MPILTILDFFDFYHIDFFSHLYGGMVETWENQIQLLAKIKSFRSYFYNAVRNRSLNYLRDHRAVSIEETGMGKEEEDFLMEMMEEEIYRELYAAIRRLPEKCQQIVLLKLAGKDNHEIAAELKITDDTVRSQLRRGKELLHKQLSGLMAAVVGALLI